MLLLIFVGDCTFFVIVVCDCLLLVIVVCDYILLVIVTLSICCWWLHIVGNCMLLMIVVCDCRLLVIVDCDCMLLIGDCDYMLFVIAYFWRLHIVGDCILLVTACCWWLYVVGGCSWIAWAASLSQTAQWSGLRHFRQTRVRCLPLSVLWRKVSVSASTAQRIATLP